MSSWYVLLLFLRVDLDSSFFLESFFFFLRLITKFSSIRGNRRNFEIRVVFFGKKKKASNFKLFLYTLTTHKDDYFDEIRSTFPHFSFPSLFVDFFSNQRKSFSSSFFFFFRITQQKREEEFFFKEKFERREVEQKTPKKTRVQTHTETRGDWGRQAANTKKQRQQNDKQNEQV